jgi:NodT family efflux transporter outer membrane factor (OMF) lipoprotein
MSKDSAMRESWNVAGRKPRAALGSLAAAALGVLSACSVGPRFERPETPTPAGYVAPREPQGGPGTTPTDGLAQQIVLGSSPAADWWTLFHSDPLNELIRQAVADNHTLAAAKATLAETRELVAAQTGARYPQLDFTAGVGRQQYGAQFLGPFVLPPFTYGAFGLQVRYLLDYTGGVARSIEQREALAQYQRSETDAAYLTLTGNVVLQAMMVASTRAQIDAVTRLLDEDRNNANLVRTAFENGSVTRVDVLTAESQLASDETLLPPLRQQLAVARHALAVLVGRAPADWSPPDFDLSGLSLPRELPVTLPSQLVHTRPDILAAEAQLHAATAAVGVATANLYPQITLSATASQQGLNAEHLFDAASNAWTLIGGLTAPLFDGGTLRAERRATLDALHASAARYQQVVVASFGQVADLLEALNHDAELLAAQSRALATAQNNLDLARESYRAGNTGVLQVLDAQRLHEQAELGYIRAEAQRYLDTTQLFLALGGNTLS